MVYLQNHEGRLLLLKDHFVLRQLLEVFLTYQFFSLESWGRLYPHALTTCIIC